MTLHWDHIDDEAVRTAKILAADAVEQAGSGHPGTAISLAPAAYLLYNKVMNVDPADPRWIGATASSSQLVIPPSPSTFSSISVVSASNSTTSRSCAPPVP